MPSVIAGDQALADFRGGLTGNRAFELLDEGRGRLLVQLPVGTGKSEWLRKIILHASSRYDLTVVLAPRTDILDELIRRLPAETSPLLLVPRPKTQCGPLDTAWRDLEQLACGSLGREDLCGACPWRSDCSWPNQFGDNLVGQRLILATQQQLAVNRQFVDRLCQHTGASRPLVLVDESDLLLWDSAMVIRRDHMNIFMAAQETAMMLNGGDPLAREWLEASRVFSEAETADFWGTWRFPPIDPSWALQLQRTGQRLAPGRFNFLAYALHHFSRSDLGSRERMPNGDIRFAGPPQLGREFIVFTGSLSPTLMRYRLDPNYDEPRISSPFAGYQFRHPGTNWFNISSLAGTAKYFRKNAPAILEFFAAKIVENIRAGKRTVLIARKKFFAQCREYLEPRLTQLIGTQVRIVTHDWDMHDLDDLHTLPLINYGISGVNRFEQFDAAYCLCGYYVNEAAVARVAQDIEPESQRWRIRLSLGGTPLRRLATVEHADAANTILPAVVQALLEEKEPNVVVQAVGRARPFTSACEIITFQMGQLRGVQFTKDFSSISAARSYFGVATRRRSDRDRRALQARALRTEGTTLAEIAAIMHVSLSTVKRYLQSPQGVMNPL